MMSLRRGIRFRVTAVAVGVLTLILALGGVILVAFQRSSLTTTIDQALTQRADDLTALVTSDADLDGSFPAGAGEGFAQFQMLQQATLLERQLCFGQAEGRDVPADQLRPRGES